MLKLPRRSFLCGLGSLLVAAPAIVRIENIMPVRPFVLDDWSHECYPLGYVINFEKMVQQMRDLLFPGRDLLFPGLEEARTAFPSWSFVEA